MVLAARHDDAAIGRPVDRVTGGREEEWGGNTVRGTKERMMKMGIENKIKNKWNLIKIKYKQKIIIK